MGQNYANSVIKNLPTRCSKMRQLGDQNTKNLRKNLHISFIFSIFVREWKMTRHGKTQRHSES